MQSDKAGPPSRPCLNEQQQKGGGGGVVETELEDQCPGVIGWAARPPDESGLQPG